MPRRADHFDKSSYGYRFRTRKNLNGPEQGNSPIEPLTSDPLDRLRMTLAHEPPRRGDFSKVRPDQVASTPRSESRGFRGSKSYLTTPICVVDMCAQNKVRALARSRVLVWPFRQAITCGVIASRRRKGTCPRCGANSTGRCNTI
jgi:hypothetical protein